MRTSEVWAYPRSSDWWKITARRFTDEQQMDDFRVSRETFKYIYTTLKPALQRQDTSYRLCIPLGKLVAIALYKLASTTEYRTVANLFAVSRTSVCCQSDLCLLLCAWLLQGCDCNTLPKMYQNTWSSPTVCDSRLFWLAVWNSTVWGCYWWFSHPYFETSTVPFWFSQQKRLAFHHSTSSCRW